MVKVGINFYKTGDQLLIFEI